jgi:sugar fermentation stimulation protein A
MKYGYVTEGVFIDRPNRFVANVLINGEKQLCHVKNTGRCRELLIPAARVVLARGDNPGRKTGWDLIAVWKGDMLINMDSQAPNAVFAQWAARVGFPQGLTYLKPEVKWGSSRFDFYYEAGSERGYIEVKGVTLEAGGIARFPDAPTSRGARHVRELIAAKRQGLGAHLVFVIQMAGMKRMEPNYATDPEFARALKDAGSAGVNILALGCRVEEDSLEIAEKVDVHFDI